MNPDRIRAWLAESKVRAWLAENRIRAAAVILMAVLLLLFLVGLLLVNLMIGRIGYEPDAAEPVTIDRAYAAGSGIYFPDIEPVREPGVINVLFLGTDFAVGADGTRGRADSNMLCSLDTRSGAIRLVSFERGIGVPVPGRGSDLLTHAYHWGGPELSQSIIAQMFAVEVDGYAQVDFSSFADVIDAIGGVDVELTEMEAKALNGAIATNVWAWVEVHEGMNHLCGHDALEYCRLRSIDSDWNRQMRQRKVLEQIQKSCRKMSPLQLVKLAGEVLPLVHTNLSRSDVKAILRALPKLMRGDVGQLQVPDKNGGHGVIRCIPDYEARKIANFLYDAGYELKSPY
jgi:LCP family protein required for cell wall assembly